MDDIGESKLAEELASARRLLNFASIEKSNLTIFSHYRLNGVLLQQFQIAKRGEMVSRDGAHESKRTIVEIAENPRHSRYGKSVKDTNSFSQK
jgi:hypothetical protein